MNLIQSLLGRRQFLIAAGVTSTAALVSKKLAGFVNPGLQTGDAIASEKAGVAGIKGDFSSRYSHLLSPINIGNVTLRNRMLYPNALPHHIQNQGSSETFPNDAMISYYANVARNGAAVVTLRGCGSLTHKRICDLNDRTVQLYLAQMADAVHFYGSKMNVALTIDAEPEGVSISEILPPDPETYRSEKYRDWGAKKEISLEMIQKTIEDWTNAAKLFQEVGFDMVSLYMSYRSSVLACSLSPAVNKRTDKYGGSLEKRARLTIDVCQSIKKACGQDFLIGANISGEERGNGYTVRDAAEYAKLWEGVLDILVVRGMDQNASHPNGYNLRKGDSIILRYSKAIKDGGTKIVVAPNGGFQDLDLNEEYIATGKADMIAMARAWIADPEYGKKAYEGRGEDVVPCILCGECHGPNEGPWIQYCSVNPNFGIAHKVHRMIDAPEMSRKVAVIGGGPAGMKAAITAAERGHKVTLFEKNDFLGGQLKYTDYVSFKWPYRDFKDYLIRQLKKAGVEVLLSTKATPEMIRARGYDAVLAATGAEPIIPDIPGTNSGNVLAPTFVYGNEKALGKDIVVIGGDLIGTETGMHLAEKGHNVTILTTEKSLATDASVYINWDLIRAYEALENLGYITEARATGISGGRVTYLNSKGDEKSIRADSVVIYAGRKPRQEEAMKFSGSAKRFFIIGDCSAHGNVRTHFQANVWTSVRSGFAAASEL